MIAHPFEIPVNEAKWHGVKARLAAYPWFDAPIGGTDEAWMHGMSTPVLKDVVNHWLTAYDWAGQVAELNRYAHYKAEVDGLDLHFIHIVGEAKGTRPLLITHGWPGSFYEFWQVIEALAYPARSGHIGQPAFDLIIPSLPGYAYAGKPQSFLGPRATAALWDKLMCDVLGYKTYLAQGGDWGSMVTSWLGLNHGTAEGKGGCAAIHLNMVGFQPFGAKPETPDEKKWVNQTKSAMRLEGSYFMQQATKPQTLSFGMMDSPTGQAAWILEKFHAWSDLKAGDLWSVYTRDQLLTNLMLYIMNDAFATSVRYYQSFMMEGGPLLPEGAYCQTPTGFTNYPGEKILSAPPKSWVERAYNINYWAKADRGGHFAAMEVPELYIADVRAWAASL